MRGGTLVQRGNVFTPDPSPGNPYVIQFARYYRYILAQDVKNGKGTGVYARTCMSIFSETRYHPPSLKKHELLCTIPYISAILTV
jgi:hypothetical protein